MSCQTLFVPYQIQGFFKYALWIIRIFLSIYKRGSSTFLLSNLLSQLPQLKVTNTQMPSFVKQCFLSSAHLNTSFHLGQRDNGDSLLIMNTDINMYLCNPCTHVCTHTSTLQLSNNHCYPLHCVQK